MIDPNTGMPIAAGADGNKELDDLILSKMIRTADGTWCCLSCDYERSNRGDVSNHVEAKHIEFGSVACELCDFITKTRKALKMHVFRMHVKKQREWDKL